MGANRDDISRNYLHRIGKNLKILRVEHEIAQDELARASNTTRAQLSGIERGQINPSALTLIKIAHALQVPVGELFRGIDVQQSFL